MSSRSLHRSPARRQRMPSKRGFDRACLHRAELRQRLVAAIQRRATSGTQPATKRARARSGRPHRAASRSRAPSWGRTGPAARSAGARGARDDAAQIAGQPARRPARRSRLGPLDQGARHVAVQHLLQQVLGAERAAAQDRDRQRERELDQAVVDSGSRPLMPDAIVARSTFTSMSPGR